MNSKRRVSKVDERMLRENEYIGRVLNERVKELDRLKGKFERKLQQEKERFAVRHLSITSNFNQRKGLKKKISLAFDSRSYQSGEQHEIRKSPSVPLLSEKTLKPVCGGTKMNCLFPPITNNTHGSSIRQRISASFSEGMAVELQRRSQGISPDYSPTPEESLPKWQKDLIEEKRRSQREEKARKQSSCDSQIRSNSLTSDRILLKRGHPSWERMPSFYDTDSNRESQSDQSSMQIQKDQRERGTSDGNREKIIITAENEAKKPRYRKQSDIAKTNQNITGSNLDITGDMDIDVDNITSVNMVKNLSKQQRFNLEHKVTFLPPMGCKFREDTSTESSDNAKDTKRLVMAKQRWLKAYNAAKANFKGKGPKTTDSPTQEIKNEQPMPTENCTKDPRLLELVSLLRQTNSLCLKNSNQV